MDERRMLEGTAPFHIRSIARPCSTYYKVVGDLRNGDPPAIILHGGPGSGHEYLLPFAALWHRHQIPVVLYDQIGCASSTHLKDKAGDKNFWTAELFIQQLESLLDALHLRDEDQPGYYLLGHSFGGMLASHFASRQPRGLRKLIIASSPGTFDLYADSVRLRFQELSQETQRAVEDATRTGNYTTQSYKDAELSLLKNFWCRADPFPPTELEARMRHQSDDRTVFTSLYGPSLLECTGSLHDWKCYEAWSQITVPTLVYVGENDTVREEAFVPFVKSIPGVRLALVSKASHMAHIDDLETQEKVLELVGGFLSSDSIP